MAEYDLVMLQLEMTMEVTKYVAACAHRAGVPVMLNPAPASDLDEELLSCMHNVNKDDIFRPAAWNAFGMDKEGQDYRACAAYGPLYK